MLINERQKERTKELLKIFWDLQKGFMNTVRKTADYHGLSVPQVVILMAIQSETKMTQKVIQEKTNLPKSTLSHAVHQLVELELLERSQVKDNRREVLLSLNKKGQKLIHDIYSHEKSAPKIFCRATSSLSCEQQFELKKIFKQMIMHFEEEGSEKE